QIAHVYVNEPRVLSLIEERLRKTDGIMHVYSGDARKQIEIDHERAGDLVVLAERNAWFTYYYWLDDSRAPDFARTVDIHRKPGYDPAELFIDPKLTAPKFRIARKLLARKLGFRNLLDVTPLDATLVKGSHGIPALHANEAPLLMTNAPIELGNEIKATDVYDVIWNSLTK
ncbi:MAG TPA: hypothetical protein PK402_14560, partial [Tepidisphaeraceae bacterium]|nr:hypothetical protein [Tepidisphaeraceae bacterium]